ncbi:ABC transporter permease [Mycobacterium sp. Marseille-P9652]|uniref:ABC transporter permease n=1 Tax=Mycobacterium sp. Marseille-P9652 TaxID=2654950 RepID=UPI0012E70C26|nr:ABC transporter permease [Mycobacterium sp. Marseille-P9652]
MTALADALPGAEPPSRNPLTELIFQTRVLTWRLLLRAARTPMTLVHGVLLPASFLLMLKVVFGNSITAITGQDSIYRSVALVALLSAMSGSSTGMVGINTERLGGFLGRLWALPIHRAAGLLARLGGETVRLLFTTLVILGVGVALGFRFHRAVGGAALWVALPVVFGVAFAALSTTAALYWPRAIMVEATQPVIVLGVTFCTGFVPANMYPDWVQPMVRNQPMSLADDAMRGLSAGGPVWTPATEFLLWCGGIILACLWPIMVGYRRASTR